MAIFNFQLSCPQIERRLERIESHLQVLEEFRTLAADAKALADRTPEPTEPPIEEPPVE